MRKGAVLVRALALLAGRPGGAAYAASYEPKPEPEPESQEAPQGKGLDDVREEIEAARPGGLRQQIPRTSQEQWKGLRKVDVTDMRPGDLIIYQKDAGHVAMYVGDGAMVHAPRTGRQIRVEGSGALPILRVVRPDAA